MYFVLCLGISCDADPAALAKYVVALIKKDKPEKDLKTVCLDQLEVFLQKETITFVDTLFETISNKSYLKPINTSNTITTTTPSITANTSKPSSQTSGVTAVASHITSGQTEMSSPLVHSTSDLGNNNNNNTSPNPNSTQQSLTKNESNVANHENSNKTRDTNKRNRSRSRSRSPFRNTRRNDFDGRRMGGIQNRNNGNTYFGDDRRNRRGNMANRRGNQRFGGYSRERDYRRPRDLKRGRSRSRSRSYSSESLSRSRSRSRSRSWSRERESPQNKRSRPSSRSPTPPKSNSKEGEKSKRCRDYDEKGFCMQGDLCPYDHGSDPVVLDGNVSAALGLTNQSSNSGSILPLTNTGIAANTPNSFLAEPYNPEAPGMDSLPGSVQRPHPQQAPVPPPPLGPPRLPPPHPYWGPMHAIRGPMPPTGPPLPPPQFMPPPGRQRELIGVQTIDNNSRHNQSLSNRTVIEPNVSLPMGRGMRGMNKGIGRGNYRNVRRVTNDSADKTCLEVRKIPSNMNTISHLNQHFSKFGTIVNLQVRH